MSAHTAFSPPKVISIPIILTIVLGLFFELSSRGIISVPLPEKTPSTIGVFFDIVRVVDGDTIVINMEGKNESVRLLGINTPESVDPRRPVECFGKEASKRMEEIAEGKKVRLEYDESQGYRDAYDRLLAYVYLEDEQMINRKMIMEGYAYEYTYLTPYLFQKEFRDAQKFAKSQNRGLWNESACNGSRVLR
jgi:micrococcal nuclease